MASNRRKKRRPSNGVESGTKSKRATRSTVQHVKFNDATTTIIPSQPPPPQTLSKARTTRRIRTPSRKALAKATPEAASRPEPPAEPAALATPTRLSGSLVEIASSSPFKSPTKPKPLALALLFDTSALQAEAQVVVWNIEWFIDKKPQPLLVKTFNINDEFDLPTFDELKRKVHTEKVILWAEKRNLSIADRPISDPWEARIGAYRKGQYALIEITNESDWNGVLAQLRLRKKNKQLYANEATLKAYWHMPDFNENEPVIIPKGKSNPKSVRSTVYIDSSDQEEPPTSELEDLDEEIGIGRDSVTKRQLNVLYLKQYSMGKVAKISADLFKRWRCDDSRCSNAKGACWIRGSSYYKISHVEQDQWAQLIVQKAGSATIEQPPVEWIINWIQKGEVCDVKRSGKRKEPAPNTASNASPNTAPNANAALYAAPNTAYWYPPWQYQYPQIPPPIAQAQPALLSMPPPLSINSATATLAPPISNEPSSPIQQNNDEDDLLDLYCSWLTEHEKNPGRRNAIKLAFEVLKNQWFEISAIRTLTEVKDILPGILYTIKSRITVFKRFRKEQLQQEKEKAAYNALIQMRHGGHEM